MDKSRLKEIGPYRDKLKPEGKRRYYAKLALIGGDDPYELEKHAQSPTRI